MLSPTPGPVVSSSEEQASSLRSDGSRNTVQPADVSGRFTTARRVGFAALIVLFLAMPWIRVRGRPAIFLHVAERKFYLFGLTFNAQDFWLVFFLLTGIGFALIFATTLVGRVWCGYACPQTVFLEGVYRRVERLIEGPREKRIRRSAGPFNFDRAWRMFAKHGAYLLISFALAHALLSYFVSLPGLATMIKEGPGAHVEAFVWATVMTGIMYFNFAWFREQLCLIICPYGRLQSILTDQHTVVVGYDTRRGEPRGKSKQGNVGDCVDCRRCVVVCPTGIDIRNGLQLDCIGCTACIDACDEIMVRLKRPTGLVRYDSLSAFAGGERKILRPRILFYAVLGVIGAVVAAFAVSSRTDFESNLLRMSGAPYVLENGYVRNSFELHVINKRPETTTFQLHPDPGAGLEVTLGSESISITSLGSVRVPVLVRFPADQSVQGKTLHVHVKTADGHSEKDIVAPVLGPR